VLLAGAVIDGPLGLSVASGGRGVNYLGRCAYNAMLRPSLEGPQSRPRFTAGALCFSGAEMPTSGAMPEHRRFPPPWSVTASARSMRRARRKRCGNHRDAGVWLAQLRYRMRSRCYFGHNLSSSPSSVELISLLSLEFGSISSSPPTSATYS
jgi:hypothetical protein